MLNETINQIPEASNKIISLSYDQWTTVSQNPIFLITLGIVFLFVFIAFLGAGFIKTGGKYFKKRMMEYSNYWILFTITFILLPGFILAFVIFPFWLKWLGA